MADAIAVAGATRRHSDATRLWRPPHTLQRYGDLWRTAIFRHNDMASLWRRYGDAITSMVFALREISLTKIESRPHKKRPFRIADANSPPLKHFDYLFYMDLEASMADPKTQNALGNLKEFATFLRVLGSYPTDLSEA